MELSGPVAEIGAQPAATVVLLRHHQQGPQALMLRRRSRVAYGGMWVFPGGRVDRDDLDPLSPEDQLAAARRAAVREVAEETGLVVGADALVPLAHWVPPLEAPRRFSTWFFVAAAPEGAVEVDGAEIREHRWLHPGEALRQQAEGAIELVPPTWVTLWRLRSLPSVAAALEAARGAEPEHFSTHMVSHDGELVALWHGDAGYDDGDVQRPGARHRLRMSPGAWRYERSAPPVDVAT